METLYTWAIQAYQSDRDPTINEPTLPAQYISAEFGGSIPVTWLNKSETQTIPDVNTPLMKNWQLKGFIGNDPETALLIWWHDLTNTYIQPTEEQIAAYNEYMNSDTQNKSAYLKKING